MVRLLPLVRCLSYLQTYKLPYCTIMTVRLLWLLLRNWHLEMKWNKHHFSKLSMGKGAVKSTPELIVFPPKEKKIRRMVLMKYKANIHCIFRKTMLFEWYFLLLFGAFSERSNNEVFFLWTLHHWKDDWFEIHPNNLLLFFLLLIYFWAFFFSNWYY